MLATVPSTACTKEVLGYGFGIVLTTNKVMGYFFCGSPIKAIVYYSVKRATRGRHTK